MTNFLNLLLKKKIQNKNYLSLNANVLNKFKKKKKNYFKIILFFKPISKKKKKSIFLQKKIIYSQILKYILVIKKCKESIQTQPTANNQ